MSTLIQIVTFDPLEIIFEQIESELKLLASGIRFPMFWNEGNEFLF